MSSKPPAVRTNLTQTLGQNFTINSLNFSNPSGVSITPGTVDTNSITILAGTANGNTAGSGLTVASGSGANTISSSVVLWANQTWTNSSTNPFVVSGSIGDGGGNYTLTLAGLFTFSGSSSYGGGTILSSGLLNINGDAAFGAVPVSPATNLTFAGNSTLQAGGTVSLATNRNVSIGSGVTATIDTNSNSITITGVISGGNGASNLVVNRRRER